jgi:hypothetical protein
MTRESLLDTIRRLIALGSSPNEHEARLATAKAAALMAQHNLAMVDVEAGGTASVRDYCEEAAAVYRGTVPMDVESICLLLKSHFFVMPIYVRDGGARKIMLFGDRSNVQVAVHVYTYLLRTFRQLARARRVSASDRSAYYVGVKDGFKEVLDEQRKRDFGGVRCTALVATGAAELHDAFRAHYGRTTNGRHRRLRGSYAAQEQGRQDGRSIKLHKAVDGHGRQSIASERKQLS